MPHPTELKRALSLPVLIFYGIGTIIGAGIYVLVGEVAGVAGSAAPFAFLVAALLVLFSAFSYAELAARFPLSAGEAIYVREGLRSTPLAVVVGLGIAAAGIISSATLLHGFVGYLQLFVSLPAPWVITLLVLLMGAVVAWGIRQSALLASVMTLAELFGLMLVLWVSRAAWEGNSIPLTQAVTELDTGALSGILLGSFIAFYAFVGFEDIVNVAEETRAPQRNLPRAIIIAWVVTTLLYLAVSTAAIMVVAPAKLAQSAAPLALVYEQASGQSARLLSFICLLSVLNGALVQIVMASRMLYGLAQRGWLPQWLGRVEPRTRTPVVATLLVSGVILLLALALPLLSLAKMTSLFTLVVFTMVNLALWRLKAREPRGPGFTVPYWVPVTGVVVNLLFLLYQLLYTVGMPG